MSLEVSVEQAADGAVLALAGEMDSHNCGSVADAIDREFPSSLPGHVRVDAAGLQFIDSSGINALLQLREQLAARGGRLTVTGATPTVRRVLEITGLLDVLGVQ